MATLANPCTFEAPRLSTAHWTRAHRRPLVVRRCMLFSGALLLLGLVLPLCMLNGWLPASLSLGFLTLALLGSGGALTLARCGEV